MKDYKYGEGDYQLSHLTAEQLFSFKKDTCIFCNEKFPVTKKKGVFVERWYGGDHYEEEWHESRTPYVRYCPTNENISYFTFSPLVGAVEKSVKGLHSLKKQQKEEEIEKKKLEYSTLINLPLAEKKIALDALCETLLKNATSNLERETREVVYHLFLGDLMQVFLSHYSPRNCEQSSSYYTLKPGESDARKKDEASSTRYFSNCFEGYFYPRGLKAHQECLPFSKKKEKLTVEELLQALQKNPLFSDYKAYWKDFPEAEKYLQSTLSLTIKPYHHSDWINQPKKRE